MLTPAQMEQVLERIDRRLTAIEQILPTLATKQDLERYATKQELQAVATRADALLEAARDEMRAVAEYVLSLTERLERKGVI